MSFRKGGLDPADPIDEELHLHDLNEDVFEIHETLEEHKNSLKQSSKFANLSDPITNLSLGSTLMQLKHKLSNEPDVDKIREMKSKIRDMIDFYDA